MNNPGIRCYERALRRQIRGFRRKKLVQETFRCSLRPFLEEQDNPTYADLEEAFGPPEQMAQELMEMIPDLPKTPSVMKQMVFVFVCCLVVIMVFASMYCLSTGPETEVTISEEIGSIKEVDVSDYVPCLDVEFSNSDYVWYQNKKCTHYLLTFKNTNQVDTTIYISYGTRQPPHTFVVSAGEQCTFLVTDAQPKEHVVSFVTPDGSMSGRMKVLIPKSI